MGQHTRCRMYYLTYVYLFRGAASGQFRGVSFYFAAVAAAVALLSRRRRRRMCVRSVCASSAEEAVR